MKKTINSMDDNRLSKKAGRVFLIVLFGYGIGLIGQIPSVLWFGLYPMDFSDLSLIFCYALYGFWPSVLVAVIKTALLSLTFFNRLCLPFPVYPIRIAVNSRVLLLSLASLDRVQHIFSRSRLLRIVGYGVASVFVSLVNGYLSYSIYLPTRINQGSFSSVFSSAVDRKDRVALSPIFFSMKYPYPVSAVLFGVFYSLSIGFSCFALYERLLNPLIFRKRKSPVFGSKVFLTERDRKHFSPFDSIKEEAIRLGEDKSKLQHRINHRRNKGIKEESTARKDINRSRYEYDLHIDEFGVRREIKLSSLVHSSALILSYLKNIYPNQNYKILSYDSLGETFADASTDGLSKEVFFQIHNCDKITTNLYSVSIRIR